MKPDMKKILRALDREYPDAFCGLVHRNPVQLLASTILSAQCTDKRVNAVSRDLFKKYRTARDFADADTRALERIIRPIGLYRGKARSLKGTGRALVRDFGSRVPKTMEELLTLPGVARKTANVVLGDAFGIAAGITVDTHVFRISRRIGMSSKSSPAGVERDLMKIVPKDRWIAFGHILISHGRKVCRARKPLCGECVISSYCRRYL